MLDQFRRLLRCDLLCQSSRFFFLKCFLYRISSATRVYGQVTICHNNMIANTKLNTSLYKYIQAVNLFLATDTLAQFAAFKVVHICELLQH